MDEFPGDDEPDDNWEPDEYHGAAPDPDSPEIPDDVLKERFSEETFWRGWWLPHDDQTAFHWSPVGDSRVNFELDGLILYGEITAERLHGIRLTGMEGPVWNPIADKYSSSVPPDESTLKRYFREYAESEGMFVYVEWEPRQPGETPDDFYKRVATVYGQLSLTNLGNTTSALAEMAEVPFSTAVHWVREARKRGHLDLSRRQRTIRGEKS